MKAVSGRDFAKVLEKHGWKCQRINGSHYIYTKAGQSMRVSVPIHRNRPLKVGLLRHLMKLAGIQESDL